jgi:hypothetical protein
VGNSKLYAPITRSATKFEIWIGMNFFSLVTAILAKKSAHPQKNAAATPKRSPMDTILFSHRVLFEILPKVDYK